MVNLDSGPWNADVCILNSLRIRAWENVPYFWQAIERFKILITDESDGLPGCDRSNWSSAPREGTREICFPSSYL